MKLWVSTLRQERGVALPLALFALVMLSGLLLAFLTMAGMEPSIAANLGDTSKARYVADAGIEWAFDQLKAADLADSTNGWNNLLAGSWLTPPPPAITTLPGLTAAMGTYTVQIRNDTLATDTAITGLSAADGGGPTSDTNRVVIVTATGTYKGVTRQIQAVMTRPPDMPAGVNLPGLGSNVAFKGNSFSITGHDTNLDGSQGTCPSVWGIGVADAATELTVQASLSAEAPNQKDNVKGKKQNPALADEGDNTIAPDSNLTPEQLVKFVNAVKGKANISLTSSGPSGLAYNSIGGSCATNWNDGNCWGYRSGDVVKPKIVYVKGDLDAAGAFNALSIAGSSTGVGILIVEDGDLRLGGTFRWEGLVIVTGKYVGIRYQGGGGQSIFGGVVVNEEIITPADPNVENDLLGNASVFYSCQAVSNLKRNLTGLYSLASWREL